MESSTVLRVEFRESRVGSEMLVINGCKYTVNRRSGETVYWRCVYSWCHSRAVIKAGQLRSARGAHVCPQPHQNEALAKIQKLPVQPSIVSEMSDNIILKNKSNSLDDAEDFAKKKKANGSFLEFVEDKSVLTKTEDPDDQLCDDDIAWKERILKGLKVYSEAERHRRFKVAYDNRKAWLSNKKYFNEKISGCITKWTNSNATWTHSNDWPTRSHCMKLTKPERGAGMFVEQPFVPIKIIEHVNPPLQEKSLKEESEFYKMEEPEIKKESGKKRSDKVNRMRKGIAIENHDDSHEMAVVKKEDIKRFRSNRKCPICGKTVQSAIERHLNVHYGIKPYKCGHCDKEHNYRAHIRSHNSDTPFSCTICPKKFASHGTLKRHIMNHSGGRTFPCNICGKIFRKSEALGFHTCKVQSEEKDFQTPDVMVGSYDEGRETQLRIPGKISSPVKRKKNMPCDLDALDEGDEEKLSKTIDLRLLEEAFRQRIEQPQQNHREEVESSVSASCKFTLDKLKYADFLQPKVALSKSLSVTIIKIMSEAEISAKRQTPVFSNLWFHSYAKSFES
ncbi:zinc finger protein 69 homolog isoform X2 [Daphnia carinata]|uniref:zinc finger protein 69 homolog isoform X2 n=1 Tax=Daphnia carinata TaxID=120202 RepID=UPI0028690DE4|nr:zinc finger protein 69 homolog isoform X2 [Daphnia carinata]